MYSCWEELDFWDRKGRDMSGKIDLDLAALGDLGYGKSLAIVGLERGSGKTTLTDNLLQLSRRTNSPVAVLSIGYERPARGSNSSSGHYHGASLPRPAATESTETTGEYRVSPGDLVFTTLALLHRAQIEAEILALSEGRADLGGLVLARVHRPGRVSLAGAEHFSQLAEMIRLIRTSNWAHTILVDGAAGRITQIRALGEDLQFILTVHLNRRNYVGSLARLRFLDQAASTPVLDANAWQTACGSYSSAYVNWTGPLCQSDLAALPQDLKLLRLEDLTKVFIEPTAYARLYQRGQICLARSIQPLAVYVSTQGLGPSEQIELEETMPHLQVLIDK